MQRCVLMICGEVKNALHLCVEGCMYPILHVLCMCVIVRKVKRHRRTVILKLFITEILNGILSYR